MAWQSVLALEFWTQNKYGRLLTVFILVSISIGLGGLYLVSPVDQNSQHSLECAIADGSNGSQIAQQVYNCGAIRNALMFRMVAQIKGVASTLKAGVYIFSPRQSTWSIVDQIAQGRSKTEDRQLTVPEGLNVWELDKLLLKDGFISRPGEFSSRYGADEGYFFPETYRFSKSAELTEIASKMKEQFKKLNKDVNPEKIIIASILEKEAKTTEDMAKVAGIIYERIRLGMLLQIDATTAYGWCLKTFGYTKPCDVTQAPLAREVKIVGPYNTYTQKGLPPGPIANPGLRALNAAANPITTDYLFYLSSRDGSQIIYARTLAEHLINRQKYLGF